MDCRCSESVCCSVGLVARQVPGGPAREGRELHSRQAFPMAQNREIQPLLAVATTPSCGRVHLELRPALSGSNPATSSHQPGRRMSFRSAEDEPESQRVHLLKKLD